MFRRKDDDIAQDLLGDSDTSMNNTESQHEGSQDSSNSGSAAKSASPAGAPQAAKPATTPTAPQQPSYGRPQGSEQGMGGATAPMASRPTQPTPTPASPFRGASDYNRGGARPTASSAAPGSAPASTAQGGSKSGSRRVLTVGHDILLKGEIATCDRLVIEGAVDATLNEVHTVEIAESGSFKGGAEIEDAEISGIFEGDLVVRNRLVIYSTGIVKGNITYGEIEIERGGQLTGQIKTIDQVAAGKSGAKPAAPKTKEAAAA